MRVTPTRSALLVAVLTASLIATTGLAAAADVTSPAGEPADIEVGEETQEITGLEVTNTDPGEDGVDVYVNVTALESANVSVDSLNVNVSDDGVTNATVTDQNVNQNNDNTTVRMTFDVEDNATSFTVDRFELVQLGTANASETGELTYYVAASDQERTGNDAPNEDDVASASFSIVSADNTTTETATDETATDETETATDGTATDETETATETDAVGDTETATEADAGEETPTEADGADGGDGDGTATDGDGAGFGVAVALVALLGVTLLARR
jgi:PGF-CTERM protein